MASDGLNNKAQKGTCRMCLRVRDTYCKVKPVGEVRHGFATGHIWECVDQQDCDMAIERKLNDNKLNGNSKYRILHAQKTGRYTEYKYFN